MIQNLFNDDDTDSQEIEETKSERRSASGNQVLNLFDDEPASNAKENFVVSEADPEAMPDSIRGMGLAYSAGVAFVAAVVFMLILGWGADLLLGSSPWGVVAGIVLGSAIGFIQLFRITSQIFKK